MESTSPVRAVALGAVALGAVALGVATGGLPAGWADGEGEGWTGFWPIAKQATPRPMVKTMALSFLMANNLSCLSASGKLT
jgi:hypothetical protein